MVTPNVKARPGTAASDARIDRHYTGREEIRQAPIKRGPVLIYVEQFGAAKPAPVEHRSG
jgi:hypothetical protein